MLISHAFHTAGLGGFIIIQVYYYVMGEGQMLPAACKQR